MPGSVTCYGGLKDLEQSYMSPRVNLLSCSNTNLGTQCLDMQHCCVQADKKSITDVQIWRGLMQRGGLAMAYALNTIMHSSLCRTLPLFGVKDTVIQHYVSADQLQCVGNMQHESSTESSCCQA